jgi:hypothetical protein
LKRKLDKYLVLGGGTVDWFTHDFPVRSAVYWKDISPLNSLFSRHENHGFDRDIGRKDNVLYPYAG